MPIMDEYQATIHLIKFYKIIRLKKWEIFQAYTDPN